MRIHSWPHDHPDRSRHDAAAVVLDVHGGTHNRAEYLLGLMPGTPDSYEWTTTLNPATGDVEVSFPSLAGRIYQVEWSFDLRDWDAGSGEFPGDGGTKTWTDDGSMTDGAPGSSPRRFYRVQVVGSP